MKTTFTFTAAAPVAKAARTKTGKPRGSNPPGARTKNEPPRMPYREELPGVNFRKPADRPKEDSIELRRQVAQATLDLERDYRFYTESLRAFEALGPLPDGIIQDLPQSIRRHLKLFKTHKPHKIVPPYRVLRTVESDTRKNVTYEIRENTLGDIWCTCPARRACKHLNLDYEGRKASQEAK